MPQKYISAIEGVWVMIDWVRANSTIVGVFFMTLFAAILRSHKDGKVDFIEALYCALIAVGLATALAGMTPPTGWTPSLVADTTNQCLSLKFNMGTTAMNLRAASMMRYVTLTY